MSNEILNGTAIVITLGALWPASAQTSADNTLPKQIYGRVQVLDGSTIEFIKPRQIVRLAGYLAPRLDQLATTDSVEWPAGQVARAWLILRTLQHDVNCASVTTDANGTILAHCFVEETNLAATAIAEGIGYAFNFPGEPQVPLISISNVAHEAWVLVFGPIRSLPRHGTSSLTMRRLPQ